MKAKVKTLHISNKIYMKKDEVEDHNNLIWLEKVSYPFKINTDQILFIEDIFYARIVYINN